MAGLSTELGILIKAKDQAQGAFNSANTGLAGIIKTGQRIAPFMAVAGAAITGFALIAIRDFAKTGDEIQKMSLRTGFSTEELSKLLFVAEQSGTSLEVVEKAIKKMQQVLVDAELGLSSATDALDLLNLEFEDLEGLSPEDQFETITTALAGVEDASRRAGIAQKVFGRSGVELLPMLALGAEGIQELKDEAVTLGIVLDQDATNAAAEFNDALNSLTKSMQGFNFIIGQALVPTLTTFTQKVTAAVTKWRMWAEENQTLADALVKVTTTLGVLLLVFGTLGLVLPTVITGVKLLVTAVLFLWAAFGPVGLIVAAVIIAGGLLILHWDEVKKKAGELRDAVVKVWQVIRDFYDFLSAPFSGGLTNPFADIFRLPDFSVPLSTISPGAGGQIVPQVTVQVMLDGTQIAARTNTRIGADAVNQEQIART